MCLASHSKRRTFQTVLLSLRERRGEGASKFEGASHVPRPLTLTLSRRERGRGDSFHEARHEPAAVLEVQRDGVVAFHRRGFNDDVF